MDYVRLGSTGTTVSRLCLGCMSFGAGLDWMLSEEDSRSLVQRAIKAGINFFDTADVYSNGQSEEILGRALKHFGVRREETVVATKVGLPMSSAPNRGGLSRKHIMQSIDASLKRLNLDYVDLYQIHRFDYATPIEETLAALTDVVKAGKTLYIGASAMFSWQFAQYLALADRLNLSRFVTMQNHYNLLYREEEREMIPLCESEGIGLIPYSPLAGGKLARDDLDATTRSQSKAMARNRFTRPEDLAVIDAVRKIARARGVRPATVGIAWLLSRPAMTAPIVGATKPSQLDDPIAALDFKLDAGEIAQLESPYLTQDVMGAMRPGDPPPNVRR